jgi:hypothetical protein
MINFFFNKLKSLLKIHFKMKAKANVDKYFPFNRTYYILNQIISNFKADNERNSLIIK